VKIEVILLKCGVKGIFRLSGSQSTVLKHI
jgi:hypothetical protein